MDRSKKIGSLLHRELSMILETSISDPRIAKTTITEVVMTKDLNNVKVFLTSSESEEKLKTSVLHLNQAQSYIRHELSDRLNLRHTPEIQFLADELPTRSSRVLSLIEQLSTTEGKGQ